MGRLRKTVNIDDIQNAIHVIKSAIARLSQDDNTTTKYKQTPEMRKKAQQKYYEKNKEKIMAQKAEYVKKRRETDPAYAAKLCEYQRRKRKNKNNTRIS